MIKLSIVLISYNYKNYIQQCLDSILAQKTNFEFEVLVRDDGSNDGTQEFVTEKYSNDPRVIVFDGSKNIGVLDNILTLIDAAKGEYLCHIDADDYLTDFGYFQRAIDYLDNNKDYNIYCGGYKYQEGDLIYPENCWMISPVKHITLEDLLNENYVSFCRIFRNIKVPKKMFGSMYPDWILNFESLKNNKKAFCETETYVGIYRIHSNSMFSKKSVQEKEQINFSIKTELKKRYDEYKKNEINLKDCIFHIHLFLNTEELEKIAYENLKKIKDQGFKVLITSPKKLPLHFYEVVDIFYHDKENQLLELQYKDIEVMWHWTKFNNTTLSFGVKEIQKHGLAVLRSMIKGCQVAKMNNIKYIIRTEFDDFFGPESFKNIKNKLNHIVENGFDFHLIKNVYSYYTDISVHLMFYDCNKFLNVFDSIIDEKMYNKELINLNIPQKSTMLETFIYLMIEHYKGKYNLNINYADTNIIHTEYSDTHFNVHQNCFSLTDGVLSDVNYVFTDNNLTRKICLAVRNFSSEKNIQVDFEIKKKDLFDVETITLDSGGIGCWNIFFIDNVENLDIISIRNRNKNYHKYLVEYQMYLSV